MPSTQCPSVSLLLTEPLVTRACPGLIFTSSPGVQNWGPDGEAKLDLLCTRDASDHTPETLLQEEVGCDRDRAEGTHCIFLLLLEVAWVAGSHVGKPP